MTVATPATRGPDLPPTSDADHVIDPQLGGRDQSIEHRLARLIGQSIVWRPDCEPDSWPSDWYEGEWCPTHQLTVLRGFARHINLTHGQPAHSRNGRGRTRSLCLARPTLPSLPSLGLRLRRPSIKEPFASCLRPVTPQCPCSQRRQHESTQPLFGRRACNLSAGTRGAPSTGWSCLERGSCGAPYGRRD